MSQKDLQFIERALAHPWMFWVYFWKWPRIVRQACAEYDLLAKERDAAKAAHERSERANKIVRDWIHVTHRLSTTPEAIRAIFAAGKRLSILLVFFVITNTYGQAPPYLRNQWTTNANPLALKVISTNGVHAATNVWELDFTNTATVTVSAVSNANKVMVSFTGSASSGSSSLTNALLHAGPTNGSVGALILTAGNGVTLTTSGTNHVLSVSNNIITGSGLWTNFNVPTVTAGGVTGIADVNPTNSVASFAAGFRTGFWGDKYSIISLGYLAGDSADGADNATILNMGDYAGNSQTMTNSADIFTIGYSAGTGQNLNTAFDVFTFGPYAGQFQVLSNTTYVFNFGYFAGQNQEVRDSLNLYSVGDYSGNNQVVAGCNDIFSVGMGASKNASFKNSNKIFNEGYWSGAFLFASNASGVFNQGYESAGGQSSATSARMTNVVGIFNYGYGADKAAVLQESTNIYNYGTYTGSNQVLKASWAIYNYGKLSGANSKLTNSYDIYTFGTEAGTNLVGDEVEDLIIVGNQVGVNAAARHHLVFGRSDNTNIFNGPITTRTVTPSSILRTDSLTNIASVTIGSGLSFDGTTLTASGGSGIASVFTNNVLAGGPGLTELEFTNSSTVRVAATTNAGRSTVSYDARTNDAGVFVVQGTTDNGLYVAQSLAIASGSIRLGFTSPKLGLERPGAGHFIHYSTSSGDTTVDAVFGGAKINLAIGGTTKWQVANAGHFLATTDNTVDIGASGATRPRNVYIAGATTIGGGITNDALTASKLVRTDATKKLVSSTLDESDIAAKQAGSAVLTNLSTTRAVTNMTVTTITNVGVSLYTVPSGCAYIFVECIGGGGGGGGVDGATSQSAAGGGGGSGAYCATNITTPAASYIVTVGTNGLGGAAGNNNGTIGGTTTFTNILTALGGSGGSGDASAAGVGFAVGGAGALQTATGRVYTGGNPGHNGICVSSALAVSGGGAGSHFGGGGAPQTADVGQNATGKGAGGSGAAVITNTDRAGGNGSPGIIVIREFYQ